MFLGLSSSPQCMFGTKVQTMFVFLTLVFKVGVTMVNTGIFTNVVILSIRVKFSYFDYSHDKKGAK